MTSPTVLTIDDGWQLRQGAHDWVLEQRITRNAGEENEREEWETVGYYGDLNAACRRWMRDRLTGLGPVEIYQLLDALDAAEKRVVELLNEVTT